MREHELLQSLSWPIGHSIYKNPLKQKFLGSSVYIAEGLLYSEPELQKS